MEVFDPEKTQPSPLIVASLDEQDDFESRKAWKKVADAITRGDMDTTSYEKSIIENRQRAMRKQEKEKGTEWERRFFSRTNNFPMFQKLVCTFWLSNRGRLLILTLTGGQGGRAGQ